MTAAPPHTPDLIGRDRELARLAELVAAARSGRGGAVLVRGEPGVGKTALVERVRTDADDFRVLHCRGVEAEVELPFSGLQTLLLPLLPGIGSLPAGQREALSAALEMEASQPASIVNASMAALTLIAGVAAVQPVLVIVDDLHWMDEPSLLALAFIARRVGHDRILLLMAARDQEPADALYAEQITLEPLPADSAARLAERLLDRHLLPRTMAALSAATGGNPLALVETVRLLGDNLEQLGTDLDEPVPSSELIERGFASRLSGLSAAANAALLVVATALSDSGEVVLDALDAMDIDVGSLDEAEEAGVITRRPHSVAFSHPLLRSLVFHDATPAARRRSHAALATAARDRGARAWHAAAASQRPDEAIARELADAARDFETRGGVLAAARALEQAARLTPDPSNRARRLKHAGMSARAAGQPTWAEQLLDEGFAAASADRLLQLEIEAERIPLLASMGQLTGLMERQRQLADDAATVSLDLRRDALAMLATEGLLQSRPDISRWALDELRKAGPAEDPVIAVHTATSEAGLLVHHGGSDERAAALARSVLDALPHTVTMPSTGAVETLMILEHDDEADRLLEQVLHAGRQSGDLSVLTGALWCEGYRGFRQGDWAAADLALEQARQLSEARRLQWYVGQSCSMQALLHGSRGDDTIHELVAQVEQLASRNAYHFDQNVLPALGVHALAHGEADRAVLHLEAAAEYCKQNQILDPSALPWPGDLVEAHLLAGNTQAAEQALAWIRQRLLVSDRRLARAIIARLEGVMAAETFDEPFERALALHADLRSPFELARTQLHYGRRLRRSKRRAEAAQQFAEAARTFERLGAAPWLAQVRAEQQAAGTAAQLNGGDAAPGAGLLTSQETAVADLVAQGITNKEAAAQLFLTPKTIEWHLRQIYRKLGITSRTQLAARMQAQHHTGGAPTGTRRT